MRISLILMILTAFALSACASRPNCQPVSAFELGRANVASEPVCSSDRYAEAWRLGQTLGELESELRDLREQANPTNRQRQRIRVLQREIPQLEALARLEGWLPNDHRELQNRQATAE